MKTCEDCGCRVYKLGCVNCNEAAYIEEQAQFDGPAGELQTTETSRTDAQTERQSARSTGTLCPCGFGSDPWHWPRYGICTVGANMPVSQRAGRERVKPTFSGRTGQKDLQ